MRRASEQAGGGGQLKNDGGDGPGEAYEIYRRSIPSSFMHDGSQWPMTM